MKFSYEWHVNNTGTGIHLLSSSNDETWGVSGSWGVEVGEPGWGIIKIQIRESFKLQSMESEGEDGKMQKQLQREMENICD